MGEKLTKIDYEALLKAICQNEDIPGLKMDLWFRIEADRDAVREETLQDVLVNNFVPWESNPQAVGWRPYWIEKRLAEDGIAAGEVLAGPVMPVFRRPAKKRQMRKLTHKEMCNAWAFDVVKSITSIGQQHVGNTLGVWPRLFDLLAEGHSIELLCAERGIPTEVEE